ncbi:MAG: hypothetical protein EA364_03930 [Balneolaceae bacterium]|nr:MAG: hypothetical protein EA364_03930 [Balneolaceae bacterium]
MIASYDFRRILYFPAHFMISSALSNFRRFVRFPVRYTISSALYDFRRILCLPAHINDIRAGRYLIKPLFRI